MNRRVAAAGTREGEADDVRPSGTGRTLERSVRGRAGRDAAAPPEPAGPGVGSAARPYVHALAGLGYFVTESSVEGTDGFWQEPFARTTNFSDETWSLVAGTGVLVPLASGRHPVELDAGVQARASGETRYLREGSIVEEGDGRISIHPIESDTDFLMLRLGVRARL